MSEVTHNDDGELGFVKAAAVGGNPDARNVLGTMYEFGQGTVVCYSNGMYWYRQAAEQNQAKAQSNLARLIRIRSTRDADVVEAFKWLKLASDQGEITARVMLVDWEKAISARQRAVADKAIREFQKKNQEIIRANDATY